MPPYLRGDYTCWSCFVRELEKRLEASGYELDPDSWTAWVLLNEPGPNTESRPVVHAKKDGRAGRLHFTVYNHEVGFYSGFTAYSLVFCWDPTVVCAQYSILNPSP